MSLGSGRGRRVGTVPGPGAVAARCEGHRSRSPVRRGQSASAHRHGSRERLPGRRGDGAGGLRQVHAARGMGRGRGPSCGLGVARPLRRRPCGAACRCWHRRTHGSRRATPISCPTSAAPGSRCWVGPHHGWPRRSRPAPTPFVLMLDDLHELQIAGVPRRARRGDLGHPSGLTTRRRQPLRAAAPTPAAGLGRRLRSSGPATWLSTPRPPSTSSRRRRSPSLPSWRRP